MKLENFELTKTIGVSLVDRSYLAEVDVTTGILWWKKTARRAIARKYVGYWFFVKTGIFTPGPQAETLERAWRAQNNQGE